MRSPADEPSPSADLEQALEVYLQHMSSGSTDDRKVLDDHPELRELLEPMLHGPRDAGAPEEDVLDDFRLIRELGRGGMGVVYEAWQRSLDRRVALKLLAPPLVASPSAVARLRREAAAAGRLRHPAIVQIHGYGNAGSQHFFAMQFVDGLPLHRCSERFRRPEAALRLVTQIAEALAHAHAAGLVHRDVKPGNILVRADGSAVLTDFGLCSDESLPSMTREGGFLGTLEYAAPEQLRGERVDAKADLWSLGVVWWQLLTGRHPFAASTQEATIRNILMTDPPALHRGVPGIRVDLSAVVGRLLEKEPARRYASAGALLGDLEALRRGEPVSARASSWLERTRRWTRREPWRATALAVLVLGLVLAGVGFLVADATARSLGETMAEFDQLAAVRQYDLVVAKERGLHPPWPDRIEALTHWLDDECAPLLAKRTGIVATLQALRAQALPPTDADQEADRQAHPRFSEYLDLQSLVAALQRAQEQRDGAPQLREASLPAWIERQSALQCHALAWIRVAPRVDERKVRGEEAIGLACARAALAKTEAGDRSLARHSALVTLAWALLAVGRDAEARSCAEAGMAATPAAELQDLAAFHAELGAALADPPALLRAAEKRLRELAPEVEARRTWRFPTESRRFLHDTLVVLLDRLDHLAAHEQRAVEQRRRWARQIGPLSAHHPRASVEWPAVRAALAAADDVVASRHYRGQPLPMADSDVIGLVPIGMNPVTKLWEFYDLRSAWDGTSDPATIPIPRHRADGTVAVDGDTGIVFVLLPGGTFLMGAQKEDPAAPAYDPEARPDEIPHTATLAPFLLARHEVTQGQWARLWNGEERLRRPSRYDDHGRYAGQAITRANPVEQVDWDMARLLLEQHGMVLPTEAQWEYACRAGTDTPWAWRREDLAAHANLADRTASANGAIWACEDWQDGHLMHAPVGSFGANAFGLFDLHGNVWEWTLEEHGHYSSPMREGDGLRLVADGYGFRVYRGGGFNSLASLARSAHRAFHPASFHDSNLGLRAARLLRSAR